MSVEKYFNKLKDMVDEKELKNFWIMCGRNDFKPIKNTTKSEMKAYLKTKPQFYRNKNIANISLVFRPSFSDSAKWVFVIKIYIYTISDDGDIGYDSANTWGLTILYNANELNNNHFTIKELLQMISLASDGTIMTDMAGINYTRWLQKLKRKNIKKVSRSKRN